MSDNNSKNQLEQEREDLEQTLACVDRITREFDNMTSQLMMDRARILTLSEELRQLEPGSRSTTGFRTPAGKQETLLQEALQQVEQSFTTQNTLGKELCEAASTFAADLIHWAEDFERRESQQQQDRALLLAPSVLVVSGGNAGMNDASNNNIAPDKVCSQDTSGGKPGVIIYTSDWATYIRYTTTESKLGQLEDAYVTYFGASDEFGALLLDPAAGDTVSAEFNGVSYTHRVTISPQESWYYLNAHDAQIKQEAIAFNAIGAAAIPRLTGFAAAAGASDEIATAAVKTADADIPAPVDAGIPWGEGIRDQGMTWENFSETQLPPETRLPPNFKTFDFFNSDTEVATSTTTLNTMTLARLAKPGQLFSALVKKIDNAADFTEYALGDFPLDADQIKLRVVRVAIPSTTTEQQMEQIKAAIQYGRDMKVIVIVIETK